ncbi:MAG: hypothetical protein Kow00129_03710 [Thermoleophilia bacterium]
MVERPPFDVVPAGRIAMFINGTNFRYAGCDAFGIRVDSNRLPAHLTRHSILPRGYYYTGEFGEAAIGPFVRPAERPAGEFVDESIPIESIRPESARFLGAGGGV